MLNFDAPAKSPAHLALRRAAKDAQLDVDALRALLWLVNAHPLLLGHAKIFRNLNRILASPLFSRDAVTWAGTWTNSVAAWTQQCTWCWDSRVTLSRYNGLEALNNNPGKHPLMDQGIVRHPVTASLWNDAEPTKQLERLSDIGLDAYSMLQGHVFAAYADATARSQTIWTSCVTTSTAKLISSLST
jgi:hypothetical protein